MMNNKGYAPHYKFGCKIRHFLPTKTQVLGFFGDLLQICSELFVKMIVFNSATYDLPTLIA